MLISNLLLNGLSWYGRPTEKGAFPRTYQLAFDSVSRTGSAFARDLTAECLALRDKWQIFILEGPDSWSSDWEAAV